LSDGARLRTIETRLAAFTLVLAVAFAPLETFVTLQMMGVHGIVHPGFVASVGGVVLSLAGALRSLRARPRRAPALMCVAHAWGAGALWHSLGGRYEFWRQGGELFYGSIDVWGAAVLVALATAMFALSAYLTLKAEAVSAA
jgi:hypothetical protein